MLSKIFSATTLGLDGVRLNVEVDVYNRGFPTLTIVGLPNKAVEESKERVRTAIKNSGYNMPGCRIVVNLAPADIPKEGSLFDLPIALGILASSGAVSKSSLKKSLFVGELSLDGKVQSVSGILPIAVLAIKQKLNNIYVPAHNASEASFIKDILVYPVTTLKDLILHLNKLVAIKPSPYISWKKYLKEDETSVDFSEIRGQQKVKRALEIAAAGGHNAHLKGPPGAGKTMLAKAFPGIMPSMDEEEILEVSRIYSVNRLYKDKEFVIKRPFRAPHHTISRVGMIGGGTKIQPGEVSLSHRGVLFLDEFPEFPRSVLEALRQPMEDGVVTVTRASGTFTFPARFVLLAASNPCSCGYLGHPKKNCQCSYTQILKYKKRLSGPILDRIDLHVDVGPVEIDKLTSTYKEEQSKFIRKRVEKARYKQLRRFSGKNIKTNAEMSPTQIKKYCNMQESAREILKQAIIKFSFSARAYFKTIKVARTIADLSEKNFISSSEILEAIQYRIEEY